MTPPNVRAGYTPPVPSAFPLPVYGEGDSNGDERPLREEGVRALHDLALTLVIGCFDEVYSPVQRLTILTAIDIWTMALAASRDAALLESLSHFWAHLQTRDYPSAYAEALIATRPTAFTAGVGAGYTPPAADGDSA